MRSRLSPKRVAQRMLCSLLVRAWVHRLHRRARLLHELQGLFWREWTRRQFAFTPPAGHEWNLGLLSHRDGYIMGRVAHIVPLLIKHGVITHIDSAAHAFDERISNARHSGDRTARSTRKVDEAGIPGTPGSARSRKKRSGRR